MIKPLYCYLQPKDIPEVLEPLEQIPCDKLYIKYFPYPYPHRIVREFFLQREQYTHLILHTNDYIVTKQDYEKLISDVEKYPFLEVISGTMNVDLQDELNNMAFTFDLPTLHYPRVYNWLPRGLVKGIQRVRHVGFSLTCIKRMVIMDLKIDGRNGFDGTDMDKTEDFAPDLWFSHSCNAANIPIYVDTDIQLHHMRFHGEMLVGKEEPTLEFVKWKEN
jgi:hypothetical protein